AEVETVPRERGDEQALERSVLELELKGPVEREHGGEREGDPENAGREIDRRDGRRIAPEIEHRQDESREHHSREQGRARPELEHQVLARHRPRLLEQLTHPSRLAGTPRRSPRRRVPPAAPAARTAPAAEPPRPWRARHPRRRCASPAPPLAPHRAARPAGSVAGPPPLDRAP